MPSVTFRKARLPEARHLAELIADGLAELRLLYRPAAIEIEKKRNSATALRKRIRTEPWCVLVAVAEGRIVGSGTYNLYGGTAWIEWLHIRKEMRRQGLGSALLRFLLRTAKARGAHKAWGDTRPPNRASVAMVKSVGFRKAVTLRNHWFKLDYNIWERRI